MKTLPQPQEQLWQNYCAAEDGHSRELSKTALSAFLDSLQSLPLEEWRDWAYGVSRRAVDLEDRLPIRMPVFEQILFPALLAGIQQNDAACARWLSGFSNLLCQRPNLLKRLEPYNTGPNGLLRHALALDPTNSLTRRHLIRKLVSQFQYALHEIPSGVLYDHGQGATAENCDELLDDVALLQDLLTAEGLTHEHQQLLKACQFHFTHYQKFLVQMERFQDYPHYLDAQQDVITNG